MIDFQQYFDESHQLIRDSARRSIEREVLPCIDEQEEVEESPRELYLKAGVTGILDIGYPEAYGSSCEGDLFVKVAASEELMCCDPGDLVAELESLDIGLSPVVKWTRSEAREWVVPAVLRGEKIMVLAIIKPSGGSDVADLKTRAVRDGDHYYISGSKILIISGVRADHYMVAAHTGGEGFVGISLLSVERGTTGFNVGCKLKRIDWWASDIAELSFDDCQVPVENLIGAENVDFACIVANFQSGRLVLAAVANMTARLAPEESLHWACKREAFGRPIGKFQVLRRRPAEMATQLGVSRESTYRQAAEMTTDKSVIKEISMVKNFATDVVDYPTYDTVQVLGSMGYTRGGLVEWLYRDDRILSVGGGSRGVMNGIIGKQMGL